MEFAYLLQLMVGRLLHSLVKGVCWLGFWIFVGILAGLIDQHAYPMGRRGLWFKKTHDDDAHARRDMPREGGPTESLELVPCWES